MAAPVRVVVPGDLEGPAFLSGADQLLDLRVGLDIGGDETPAQLLLGDVGRVRRQKALDVDREGLTHRREGELEAIDIGGGVAAEEGFEVEACGVRSALLETVFGAELEAAGRRPDRHPFEGWVKAEGLALERRVLGLTRAEGFVEHDPDRALAGDRAPGERRDDGGLGRGEWSAGHGSGAGADDRGDHEPHADEQHDGSPKITHHRPPDGLSLGESGGPSVNVCREAENAVEYVKRAPACPFAHTCLHSPTQPTPSSTTG